MTLRQFRECLEARVRRCQKYLDDPHTRSFSDLKYYSLGEVKGQLQELKNTLDMLKEVEQ